MNGLLCGEEIMTIRSAVLIQYQRVTDGWTDGRPAYISITCFSIADARKNGTAQYRAPKAHCRAMRDGVGRGVFVHKLLNGVQGGAPAQTHFWHILDHRTLLIERKM